MEWVNDVEFDGDRAVVTVSLDGDALHLTLNESLDVVSTERE
jgi:hypothetical protein